VSRLPAAGLGVARGVAELRQTFTYLPDTLQVLFFPVAQLVVLVLMRGQHVHGTTFSLGSLSLPSVIGMGFAFGGVAAVSAQLVVDRDDGTLLRAKATPNGVTGFVVGRITYSAAISLTGMVLTVVTGLIAFPGVRLTPLGAVTIVWVGALGLVATIPVGMVLGSLVPNPRFVSVIFLPFGALTAISGIFYPITHLPGWVQMIGQVFPMYWLGLGMRAGLLPPSAAAVEIDGSWRLPYAFLVLVLWSVAGLAAAPPVLRRMARRESGSRVAARRERAMLRTT
jgi:ABC-2 type transport system permease protein